jgi:Ser/Thr protein kinase RdoA (MazF antagonist)
MAPPDMPHAVLLERLGRLARAALGLWDLPAGAEVSLLNVSENTTWLVTAPGGFRSVLRIHRAGYHSRRAIACELAWAAALRAEAGLVTPAVRAGRNGAAIQSGGVPGLPGARHMVMFDFLPGRAPDPDDDLVAPFRTLGAMAARTHLHSMRWTRPEPFERLTWDLDAVYGPAPTWGDWRDAPNVTPEIRAVLEAAEDLVRRRLSAFGTGPDRYGLIHADMRLANLLVDEDCTRLIDFDDCGFGWFLYDFAAAISFMEDHRQVPALKAAWLEGYRSLRPLSQAEAEEIDTFVMLRRMALLAWIGSHIEAPEPQALAPDFARVTADLARDFLRRRTPPAA